VTVARFDAQTRELDRLIQRTLAHLDSDAPPPALTQRVRAAVEREAAGYARLRRSAGRWRGAVGIAAAVLLAVGLQLAGRDHGGNATAPSDRLDDWIDASADSGERVSRLYGSAAALPDDAPDGPSEDDWLDSLDDSLARFAGLSGV
jgi:hypothetical protein